MEVKNIDNFGQQIFEGSIILTDSTLGERLKAFDKNLNLYFDAELKRWVVREWAPDNSGWNKILIAEDKDGNPEPLGDWIFKALKAKRDAFDMKMAMGPSAWLKHLNQKAQEQKAKMADQSSQENIDAIRDDIVSYRKAAKQWQGGAASDVTAGYRKISK